MAQLVLLFFTNSRFVDWNVVGREIYPNSSVVVVDSVLFA